MNKYYNKRIFFILLRSFLVGVVLGIILYGSLNIKNFNEHFGNFSEWIIIFITMFGIYFAWVSIIKQINAQKEEDLEISRINNRVQLNLSTKYGIEPNEKVYHSTNSVDMNRLNSTFYKLTNIDESQAYDILISFYFDDELIDILYVTELKNDYALLMIREIPTPSTSLKINIVYKTKSNEFMYFTKKYKNNVSLKINEYIIGDNAKAKHKEILNLYNEHNGDGVQLAQIWNQNYTTFSEKELNFQKDVYYKLILGSSKKQ